MDPQTKAEIIPEHGTCKQCWYAVSIPTMDIRSPFVYECRRYPAIPIALQGKDPTGKTVTALQMARPRHEATDWCGEFEPQDDAFFEIKEGIEKNI